MSVDFPTALGIIAVGAMCVLAVSLAYSPDKIGNGMPPSESKEMSDGKMLFDMKALMDAYQDNGMHEKAEQQEDAMRQKLMEMARDYLEINVLATDIALSFNPAISVNDESQLNCDPVKSIPIHLKNIHSIEWFKMFAGKYSEHAVEMYLQNEGPDTGLHYGFTAISGDGRFASTHFHADLCTNKIIDAESYFLTCRDKNSDYFFRSSNYDDIVAGLNLEEFCIIPTSPWRQMVHDYAKEVSDVLRQYMKSGETLEDAESMRVFSQELQRLDSLRGLADMIVHSNDSEEKIQENILEYCNEFGSLPEDFAVLVEDEEADKRLFAC